jgi:hypothetical protein
VRLDPIGPPFRFSRAPGIAAASSCAAATPDNLILAATSLVHGLAHLIIQGATEVKPGDVGHAVRLAREVTAVLGAGLLPRETQPKRGSR